MILERQNALIKRPKYKRTRMEQAKGRTNVLTSLKRESKKLRAVRTY